MTPQLGDYACRTMGGTGKLISIAEYLDGDGFSTYDHAEIYVGRADKQNPWGFTMGAYPGGAHLVALQEGQVRFPEHNGFLWSTGKIDLTQGQREAIATYAMACGGIGYSAADYFALAAHRLHIPVPGLKEYIASSHRMICSQLCDYAYRMAGVHLFRDGRWPGYVTPQDLADLILGRKPGG